MTLGRHDDGAATATTRRPGRTGRRGTGGTDSGRDGDGRDGGGLGTGIGKRRIGETTRATVEVGGPSSPRPPAAAHRPRRLASISLPALTHPGRTRRRAVMEPSAPPTRARPRVSTAQRDHDQRRPACRHSSEPVRACRPLREISASPTTGESSPHRAHPGVSTAQRGRRSAIPAARRPTRHVVRSTERGRRGRLPPAGPDRTSRACRTSSESPAARVVPPASPRPGVSSLRRVPGRAADPSARSRPPNPAPNPRADRPAPHTARPHTARTETDNCRPSPSHFTRSN